MYVISRSVGRAARGGALVCRAIGWRIGRPHYRAISWNIGGPNGRTVAGSIGRSIRRDVGVAPAVHDAIGDPAVVGPDIGAVAVAGVRVGVAPPFPQLETAFLETVGQLILSKQVPAPPQDVADVGCVLSRIGPDVGSGRLDVGG